MHLSTKTGYALRALAMLARTADQKPISIATICKTQNLPPKYIEHLFRKLKLNNIVKSVQGASGGYILNKSKRHISLKDIMEAVEEDYSYKYCDANQQKPEFCSGFPCEFYALWDEINTNIEKYLETFTLDMIVQRIGD